MFSTTTIILWLLFNVALPFVPDPNLIALHKEVYACSRLLKRDRDTYPMLCARLAFAARQIGDHSLSNSLLSAILDGSSNLAPIRNLVYAALGDSESEPAQLRMHSFLMEMCPSDRVLQLLALRNMGAHRNLLQASDIQEICTGVESLRNGTDAADSLYRIGSYCAAVNYQAGVDEARSRLVVRLLESNSIRGSIMISCRVAELSLLEGNESDAHRFMSLAYALLDASACRDVCALESIIITSLKMRNGVFDGTNWRIKAQRILARLPDGAAHKNSLLIALALKSAMDKDFSAARELAERVSRRSWRAYCVLTIAGFMAMDGLSAEAADLVDGLHYPQFDPEWMSSNIEHFSGFDFQQPRTWSALYERKTTFSAASLLSWERARNAVAISAIFCHSALHRNVMEIDDSVLAAIGPESAGFAQGSGGDIKAGCAFCSQLSLPIRISFLSGLINGYVAGKNALGWPTDAWLNDNMWGYQKDW